MPHTEPRDFYVSLIRDKRVALLAGPFATHTEALAAVDRAADAAYTIDPWSHFDLRGTCSLPRSDANPIGKLNAILGVDLLGPSAGGRS